MASMIAVNRDCAGRGVRQQITRALSSSGFETLEGATR
jgi:hypothetical protein